MEIPKLTREEFEKVIEYCTSQDDCIDCPLCESSDICCGAVLAHYIKENEPAPAGTDTSSNDEKYLHLDDSTSKQICQAFDKVDRAVKTILDIYNNMTETEQRAFDLGEIYRDMLSAKCELEGLKGDNTYEINVFMEKERRKN